MMIRTGMVLIAIIAILLVGQWVRVLRTENLDLRAKVEFLKRQAESDRENYQKLYYDYAREENQTRHAGDSQSASVASLELQLSRERAKLESIRHKPPGTGSSSDATLDTEINNAKMQIKSLEARLLVLQQDNSAVDKNSTNYRRAQSEARQTQRIELQAQLESTQRNMNALQVDIKGAQAMANREERSQRVRTLRAQLSELAEAKKTIAVRLKSLIEQMKNLDQAVHLEVNAEKSEIGSEVQTLQKELAEVRARLALLQKSKAEGKGSAQLSNAELEQQTNKIKSLERMIEANKNDQQTH